MIDQQQAGQQGKLWRGAHGGGLTATAAVVVMKRDARHRQEGQAATKAPAVHCTQPVACQWNRRQGNNTKRCEAQDDLTPRQ